jgi:hypothetical protein
MMTVNAIRPLPDNVIIPAVRGLLTYVGTYQKKLRPDGSEYSVQNFTLRDGLTTIPGVAYDQISLDAMSGNEVVFASMKSRNGRFGGVTTTTKLADTSLFARKTGRTALRLTKAAKVFFPADSYTDSQV